MLRGLVPFWGIGPFFIFIRKYQEKHLVTFSFYRNFARENKIIFKR